MTPHPDRVTIYQESGEPLPWRVRIPGSTGGGIYFATHDEAIHFAHDYAHDRAVRAIQDGVA